MRLPALLLLAVAPAAFPQSFGGFADAEVRQLAAGELPEPDETRARLPLTAVILRGSNWSEARAMRHLRRTASTFAACGVALEPVTLVRAKTPDGRHDLEMTPQHPRAGTPEDVYRIAGLLPSSARWPVAFFVGRLRGDPALARSYGKGEVAPGQEKLYPYMNTAWMAYKAHWIERRDEDYSSLAHELMHLLCECGHIPGETPHLMHVYRNMLSSRILPEQCESVLESPLLKPAENARTPVKY